METHKFELCKLAARHGFFSIRLTPWGKQPSGTTESQLAKMVAEEFTLNASMARVLPNPQAGGREVRLNHDELVKALKYPSRIGPVLWAYPLHGSRLSWLADSGFDPMVVSNIRSIAGSRAVRFAQRVAETGHHVCMVFGNPRLEAVTIFSPKVRIQDDLLAVWEKVTKSPGYRRLYQSGAAEGPRKGWSA